MQYHKCQLDSTPGRTGALLRFSCYGKVSKIRANFCNTLYTSIATDSFFVYKLVILIPTLTRKYINTELEPGYLVLSSPAPQPLYRKAYGPFQTFFLWASYVQMTKTARKGRKLVLNRLETV